MKTNDNSRNGIDVLEKRGKIALVLRKIILLHIPG
jgi:hypothetical protein